MKAMGISFIVTGAAVGAMASILSGHTALVIGIIMIIAGQLFLGGVKFMPAVISTCLVLAFLLSLSGCGGPRYAMRVPNPKAPPSNAAVAMLSNGPGKVPVVMINSSQLPRTECLLEGNEPVSIVPDYKTGGWTLSRSPLYCFDIAAAKGRDWATEEFFYYPRNSAFSVYDQPKRFWGTPVGQPNMTSVQTGAHPAATTYWQQTSAGGRQQVAGAVVYLPYVDAAGPTSGLRLEYNINPGAVIKEGIGKMLR